MSAWFMMAVCFTVTPVVSGTPLLGAKQCATCHPKAYQHWKASAHANAARHLTAAERRNPQCTRCHAPNARDGLVGVQCEICHGAGRQYWPAEIMKNAERAKLLGLKSGDDEAMCRQCHHSPTTRGQPFDYVRALERIRHILTPSTPGDRP
ncbi:MAG: multiheme c-type cytochrome [Myxococcota bacterium]|nr:multiheme c-type cytochrome [Myxococcota bacterium]